jgi:formylglycine-generating enzyme required for sulfatase activity
VGEISRLALGGELASAFQLAEQVRPIIGNDSTLRRITPTFTDFVKIVTKPSEARVFRQRLDQSETQWEFVGTTPLDSLPVPKSGRDLTYRLRIEKPGYETAELLPNAFEHWGAAPALDTLRLDRTGEAPGMVWIPGWTMPDSVHRGGTLRFADYHMGRYEVTNREYQRFVSTGGYQKREYWTEPFVRSGRPLTWEQANAEFRDQTGLPGPSTWSGGHYPAGQDDFPVGGVSYYEAAAYARFAGKQLPTAQHWLRAALRHNREASWVYIPSSNLNGTGPRAVGQGTANPYGLYDVAGNVREWCVNPVDSGRLTRGGGWEDPEFLVGHLQPKPEFDRSAANGFRLMTVTDNDTLMAHVNGRVVRPAVRDFRNFKPVSDAEFAIFRRLFEYDKPALNPQIERSGAGELYRWEKVSFSAGYGGERMAAYLLLPKDAKPPYEPVIYWPGSDAMTTRSFNPTGRGFTTLVGFLPRSGRAVVLPLYKGSFERDDSLFSTVISVPNPTPYYRDLSIEWIKDLRRTVDYLETRSDMRADRVGFYGYSWGSEIAPRALALEPRIKAAVLNTAGYWPGTAPLPEVEDANYAPRVRTPTLMLNGKYDVVFPYETTQVPFFDQLGTPPKDKKHVLYTSSHTVPQEPMARETLAWFDRYLSGVNQKP